MLNSMLLGAIAMSCLAVALFFLRFWRQTKERLFLFFALAFFVEAMSRAALSALSVAAEHEPLVYLVRLGTYLLILIAIADYNRKPPRAP